MFPKKSVLLYLPRHHIICTWQIYCPSFPVLLEENLFFTSLQTLEKPRNIMRSKAQQKINLPHKFFDNAQGSGLCLLAGKIPSPTNNRQGEASLPLSSISKKPPEKDLWVFLATWCTLLGAPSRQGTGARVRRTRY